jgi:hypothetical protein
MSALFRSVGLGPSSAMESAIRYSLLGFKIGQ